ncbi:MULTISPECIES: GerMN domain-containing protein [unclassified Leptolyngbya]|uniref:GerMN domain-containing protein n=1 Tax=unclassified Leptolyngbya TaxID=2650499 RepID=UPI001689493C|nr:MULTISPECIES: GerMN domain-containing protein [unclassified Leptolyngbya]MBD1909506.1 GerMN domain-containing protein [Leptolyngbya sp. FACHB-8]MBD2159009.1 GerMN domain-containing protein [Leptolyngbya sp. FACHB-16]
MNDEPLQHHSLESSPKRQFRSRLPLGAVTTLAAVVVATGSATAWWTWQTLSTRKATVTPPDTETVMPADPTGASDVGKEPVVQSPTQSDTASSGSAARAEMRSVSVYWVKDTGTHLEVVPSPISIEANQPPEALLQQSFDHLLKGPETTSQASVASTIPAETRINSLEIRPDGIHVDLNQAFTTGGGSASMVGRLGQVIYTATTLDPNANVWISVNGTPLETLGGEGAMVSQPMTRQAFDQDFAL